MLLPCSLPCTCKVTFLSATPAGLAATQVKVPESANCTWEILNPSRERTEREREGRASVEKVSPLFHPVAQRLVPHMGSSEMRT